jgi:hypothetical protein
METRSVVDLVDEPRALGSARRRAIASFSAVARSRSSPPNSEGCSASCDFSHCSPSNLKVGRSQCMGRLPRPLMSSKAAYLRPAQPPANDDARPTVGALSLDCALSPPISRPHPLIFGEFLVSRDLQNESSIY